MRVLVVGSGGREHALAWKLRQSSAVTEVFAAPGNAGIARVASCVPIDASAVVELADFAQSVHVDLTVVGPELPLTLGIVDEFQKRGLRIFGPNLAAAELEGSKIFSKRFMKEHGIPTADFWVATSRPEAEAVLDSGEGGWPIVIKADGLAGGKGVIIAKDRAEADEALHAMFDAKAFGNAGAQVLLEKCLPGIEVSFHVLTDGEHAVPLASAQDYKRVFDNGLGPNTGGMGAVSPSPVLTKVLQTQMLNELVLPTLRGMAASGRPYRGVLYVGVMITPDGPKVIEYNCRLGDPETQVIMARLESDLLPLLEGVVDGNLHEVHPKWAHEAAVCVVLAAKGYPARPDTGHAISGLEEAERAPRTHVFHGATEAKDGAIVSAGGRVLGVTATAPTLTGARAGAYEAVGRLSFEGAQHRSDIGSDLIAYLSQQAAGKNAD